MFDPSKIEYTTLITSSKMVKWEEKRMSKSLLKIKVGYPTLACLLHYFDGKTTTYIVATPSASIVSLILKFKIFFNLFII